MNGGNRQDLCSECGNPRNAWEREDFQKLRQDDITALRAKLAEYERVIDGSVIYLQALWDDIDGENYQHQGAHEHASVVRTSIMHKINTIMGQIRIEQAAVEALTGGDDEEDDCSKNCARYSRFLELVSAASKRFTVGDIDGGDVLRLSDSSPCNACPTQKERSEG
jgi:hypothetical protein